MFYTVGGAEAFPLEASQKLQVGASEEERLLSLQLPHHRLYQYLHPAAGGQLRSAGAGGVHRVAGERRRGIPLRAAHRRIQLEEATADHGPPPGLSPVDLFPGERLGLDRRSHIPVQSGLLLHTGAGERRHGQLSQRHGQGQGVHARDVRLSSAHGSRPAGGRSHSHAAGRHLG